MIFAVVLPALSGWISALTCLNTSITVGILMILIAGLFTALAVMSLIMFKRVRPICSSTSSNMYRSRYILIYLGNDSVVGSGWGLPAQRSWVQSAQCLEMKASANGTKEVTHPPPSGARDVPHHGRQLREGPAGVRQRRHVQQDGADGRRQGSPAELQGADLTQRST